MARGSNQRNGRAARSEAVRAFTGRSITDETTDGSRFETILQPSKLTALADVFTLRLNEAEKQKAMERGHFSSTNDRNNGIRAYSKMVIDGVGKDEFVDPKSPFNYENLKASLPSESREFSFVYDKDGRLISWNRGQPGAVRTSYLPGSLRGGIDVHNHPVEADRPLGLAFSDADILSYHKSGAGLGIVFSREGEYRVKLPPDFEKLDRYKVEKATTNYTKNQQLIWRAIDASIASGVPKDKAYMVGARMFNEEAEKLSQVLGLQFEFKPNNGYEWISNGDKTTPPSPPAFANTSRLRPHKDNFVPPPAVTSRGYTIGEPKNVKAPRKPRTPKPKQEPKEPSNNNYFRL